MVICRLCRCGFANRNKRTDGTFSYARASARGDSGEGQPLLISAIAEDARQRAARPSVFCDPRGWAKPNGIVLCEAEVPSEMSITDGDVVWYPANAPVKVRGYSVALGLARALLMRSAPGHEFHDIVRLAIEILVHAPTLARIGERSYAAQASHVHRRIVHAASVMSVAA